MWHYIERFAEVSKCNRDVFFVGLLNTNTTLKQISTSRPILNKPCFMPCCSVQYVNIVLA